MAIHRDGIQKLEPARQMNARYQEVDNFIVHFGFGDQPLQWQTVAYIEGRFELTFVVPVTVDYHKRAVTQAGEPKFVLCALNGLLPDGSAYAMDTKLERRFGQSEWDKFVSSGFDLTSLGIPENEIRPDAHWKEYVHGWRKDRVPIK